MSGQQPDLFVVCKSCGQEVSPYITECPYCGQRLRKRAPKIDRDSSGESRPRERRLAKPTLGPLRAGEIPGLAGDSLRRPYATIALVALSTVGLLLLAFLDRADLVVFGPLDGEWWRVAVSPFIYANAWYQVAAVGSIGLFGFLIERRHGPVATVVIFILSGMGSIAVVGALETDPTAFGGNGAALGLLAAWAVPEVMARRRGDGDDDADLAGTLAIGLVVAAMPLVTDDADPLAGTVGLVAGGVIGLALSAVRRRS